MKRFAIPYLILALLPLGPLAARAEAWACTYRTYDYSGWFSVTGTGATKDEANVKTFDLCRAASRYDICMKQLYQEAGCRKIAD